ncbi:MAG: hypothetical protein RLZZ352_1681 [Pseudomonadota bacterium]
MKTNMTSWVIPGVLSAMLLAACGGGGGGTSTTDGDTTTSVPSLTITAVNAQTAAVTINTSTAIQEVQVLVSTVQTLSEENATSADAESTTIRGVSLYNSAEGVTTLPNVAAGTPTTFSLKNVNFAAASSDTSASASAAVCSSDADTALGTVRLEVFSQGSQLLEKDVPVCAMQGKTYSVSL